MQGTILGWYEGEGRGFIAGDDGTRYTFSSGNLKQVRKIEEGARVDFAPVAGNVADEIFFLPNTSAAQMSTNFNSSDSVPYNLPPGHPSLKYGLNPFAFFGKAFQLYFDGRGRATVSEYWSFQLVLFGITFSLGFLLGVSEEFGAGMGDYWVGLIGLGFIGLIIPGITLTIRRLHDLGLTGWLVLIALIPYLGALALFVMSLIPSQKQANQYGPFYRDIVEK